MKKLYILFTISLLSSLSLIAQNDKTKRADKHFSRFEYVDAAEDYLDLVQDKKGSTYVYSRLADCYYNIFNTQEAERWFAKALAGSDDSELMYKYSQMLKANGKFDQSNEWMRKFSAMRAGDIRALAFKSNPNYLAKILEKGKKFNVQNLEINSENSDFGGTLLNGKLYIVSARNNARKTYGWNEEPFLDILEIPVRTDGVFGNASLFLILPLNETPHSSSISF